MRYASAGPAESPRVQNVSALQIEYPILDAAAKANDAAFGCCRRRGTRKDDEETGEVADEDLPATADHAV